MSKKYCLSTFNMSPIYKKKKPYYLRLKQSNSCKNIKMWRTDLSSVELSIPLVVRFWSTCTKLCSWSRRLTVSKTETIEVKYYPLVKPLLVICWEKFGRLSDSAEWVGIFTIQHLIIHCTLKMNIVYSRSRRNTECCTNLWKHDAYGQRKASCNQ